MKNIGFLRASVCSPHPFATRKDMSNALWSESEGRRRLWRLHWSANEPVANCQRRQSGVPEYLGVDEDGDILVQRPF